MPGSRMTITQLLQRFRETIPSIVNPYRSIIIVPDPPVEDIITIRNEEEDIIKKISPKVIRFGYAHTRQNGIAFYNSNRDQCAELTNEGILFYREPIDDGVHMGRTIVVLASMIDYALAFYRQFRYEGDVAIIMETRNTQGLKLITDTGDFLLARFENHVCETQAPIVVNRTVNLPALANNYTAIIKDIFTEFCRAFDFTISKEVLDYQFTKAIRFIRPS